MQGSSLNCPRCRSTWPQDPEVLANLTNCPTCNAQVQIHLYPAFTRIHKPGSVGETVLVEGEATCFYHPQKRAVVPCGSCGRFLCALCDLELNNEHLCPACLESGRRKGNLADLETSRTLYGPTALMLAVIGPLLCLWPAVVFAPIAIILALYGWKKPGSLVTRTRLQSAIAIGLAVLELIGIGLLIYFINNPSS
jgi:hypothetical protein